MIETTPEQKSLPETYESKLPADKTDLFEKGMMLYKRGDIISAQDVFNGLASSNPDFTPALVNLGNSYFKQKNYAEASNWWKKVLKTDPNNVICYLNLGNASFAEGNVREAISFWNIAIGITPDYGPVLLNLSVAYEKIKNKLAAYRFYELYLRYCMNHSPTEFTKVSSLLNKSKRTAHAHFTYAEKVQRRGKFRSALKHYMKAAIIYPLHQEAWINMGKICYKLERFDFASKYWIQALKIDRNSKFLYFNCGVALERNKDYSQAYCLYKRYLVLPNLQGASLFPVRERIAIIETYLKEHPEEAKKHLNLAEKFYNERQYQDSLWEYENYVLLKPDQNYSYETKIQEIRDCIDPIPKAAKMAYEIGNTLYKQKKFDKAALAYKRYIRLMPRGEHVKIANQRVFEHMDYMRAKNL